MLSINIFYIISFHSWEQSSRRTQNVYKIFKKLNYYKDFKNKTKPASLKENKTSMTHVRLWLSSVTIHKESRISFRGTLLYKLLSYIPYIPASVTCTKQPILPLSSTQTSFPWKDDVKSVEFLKLNHYF